jgi:hypothetical protein
VECCKNLNAVLAHTEEGEKYALEFIETNTDAKLSLFTTILIDLRLNGYDINNIMNEISVVYETNLDHMNLPDDMQDYVKVEKPLMSSIMALLLIIKIVVE